MVDKKKFVKIIFKALISILLLVFLFSKINIGQLYNEIISISPIVFGCNVFLCIFAIYICAIKWRMLFRKEKISNLFLVLLKSHFYTIILPGQLFGEASKIIMLPAENASFEERTSGVIVDKVTSLIALMLVGYLGAFSSKEQFPTIIKSMILSGLIILMVAMILLSNKRILNLVEHLLLHILESFPKSKIVYKLLEILNAWRESVAYPLQIIYSILWGIVYQLLVAATYYLFSENLNVHIDFYDFCWINSILTLLLLLPISLGGLGLREGTLVSLLGILGVSSEKAFSISILIFILQIISALAGWLVIVLKVNTNTKINKGKL